ncbi:MAG: ABC transporter permease [Candidatus Roizmanbacteria bacterium]|nr:ABC transporter permease [Candidatus Roizmanbacteria bacterium]
MKYYLQLLEVFTVGEIKSRYKASLLGPLWIILYPLLTTFFLSFIFENIVKIKTEETPYFIFLLSGLLFWDFFQQGVLLAKESLIWNRDLVTKTTFPKEVLPLSFIFSKIPDFLVNLLILFIFLIIFGLKIKFVFLTLILAIVPLSLFAASFGLFFSLTNAIFRDFGRIIELFLLVFFYATPILYSENLVPMKYLWLVKINPLGLVTTFAHDLLFRDKLSFNLIISSSVISLVFFILGVIFFKKFEKKIVDLI